MWLKALILFESLHFTSLPSHFSIFLFSFLPSYTLTQSIVFYISRLSHLSLTSLCPSYVFA
ncbi:hypothetical protein BC939DRAFT_195787 [Gamsiella multidivaricata]|uniref:uncharacterized protein n=1 Tax=Gamsiella multidivaricata TaxID=101098 RepID=UPI00221E7E01|nr:uncharacterized protein BC939DRAFT_195787 [Gamsiella multidivaricata]KAI7822018.1 hypothetical protein BC939DRAFT_195787 [Gamsiella multidivaricata]